MKKMATLLLTVLMLLTCFTGCAAANTGSDSAYVKEKGKLVVGITEYKPMDFKDSSGQWTGFDAEFARLFAQELGVECEFYVITDWSKKYMELDTKQIDVVWNGMTITEEATSSSSVSKPYVVNAQVVVMKADRLADYPTAESMQGLTFAVENGSAGQSAAGTIKDATVIPLQDQAAALMEVAAGTADACVIDITMAYAMTGAGTSYADLAPGLRLTEEFYGISFRKGSDLTETLNAFMQKLMKDGTLQTLADKYALTLAE